ncbi:hypothetical protein GCM10011390_45880 [Aureimonas endophytica]|uniref:Uncharacterized protein n=1 Tax=Aureimonas endophytica TaxID=2027858 RepID=A0A917A0G7_9HYPH|nr:hypothetical protein [Aureimonas endophytica]GGE21369.1 hypothetical protein GCM10011390_45880 [Aureimonas endophytica]
MPLRQDVGYAPGGLAARGIVAEPLDPLTTATALPAPVATPAPAPAQKRAAPAPMAANPGATAALSDETAPPYEPEKDPIVTGTIIKQQDLTDAYKIRGGKVILPPSIHVPVIDIQDTRSALQEGNAADEGPASPAPAVGRP